MVEISARVRGHELPLDVCTGCQFVWFDPQEFEQFPAQVHPPSDRERLPEKVREQMALMELQQDAERARGGDFGTQGPEESWKTIPAVFGLPVEHEVNPIRCWPWMTWGLSGILVLVFALTYNNLLPVAMDWGFIPAHPWRHGGLTSLTSFFLHGGLLHLIGNVYFLLVFGDNTEDCLGRWRYLALLVMATLVGDCAHACGDPRGMLPCIGASGGISGVIAFYALKFPRARLGFVLRYWFAYRWFYMPASVALICWIVLQLWLAHLQLAGISSVSALAHLGGAAVGLLVWLLSRNR